MKRTTIKNTSATGIDATGSEHKIDWDSINPSSFWEVVDKLQDSTLNKSKKLFALVERADMRTLQAILVQYKLFTVYYISDLALLIEKLEDGAIRSFLASILYDKLGCGDHNMAHPNLYDNFLVSIGVDKKLLNRHKFQDNIKLLDEDRRLLVQNRPEYGVGLRGMGGECVCQVYLSMLHEHMVLNPNIATIKNNIDWMFWDLHIGDHDIKHRLETRNIINREIVHNSNSLHDLGSAYKQSMLSWENFWNNIFRAAVQQNIG